MNNTTPTPCTPSTHRWVPVTRDFDVCTECRQSRTTVNPACDRCGALPGSRHDRYCLRPLLPRRADQS